MTGDARGLNNFFVSADDPEVARDIHFLRKRTSHAKIHLHLAVPCLSAAKPPFYVLRFPPVAEYQGPGAAKSG
jgi:hypothetical protein